MRFASVSLFFFVLEEEEVEEERAFSLYFWMEFLARMG